MILNVATGAISFIYSIASPKYLTAPTDGSYIFLCLSIFFSLTIVSIGGTYYGFSALSVNPIPPPSLSRNPFRLWKDPFQFLSTASLISLSSTCGLFVRIIFGNHANIRGFVLNLAFCGGILLGSGLSYWIFRTKLVKK